MNVTVEKSVAKGKVKAPPSKSMAHRYILCAALSAGESHIKNIEFSNDISATVDCIKNLGVKVDLKKDSVLIDGGINLENNPILPCFESGSTLRFLLPLCAALGKKITLTGTERLFSRSLEVYEEIFKQKNIDYQKTETSVTVCGKLESGEYTVKGNISSQFISGLLFALPTLSGDSTIKVTGEFESKPYVDLTVSALESFGIIITETENGYFIKGNQKFSPCEKEVEGDFSNVAFLDVFNFLGGQVAVEGLNANSLQGDKIYKKFFERLNSGFCEIDLANYPDLAPILVTFSALKHGAKFTGTRRLKIKESDRANAIKTELLKFGANVTVTENEIMVKKQNLYKPSEKLCSHNDHRIVMSLAVMSAVFGGVIEGAEAVNKSYPQYFKVLESLGIKVETDGTE